MTTKIIAFAGPTRQGSINANALRFAIEGAREAGADVEATDLKNYPMPLYDADWHTANGVPQTTALLREKMIAAQGLLIASPECFELCG